MARPRKQIDEEQLHKLAAINCTHEEIASVLNVSVDTLGRRYAEHIKKGREHGKSSLKRKMWETAMGGNVTMMIWLSKQMLGYTDKNPINIKEFSDEVLANECNFRLMNDPGHKTDIRKLLKPTTTA